MSGAFSQLTYLKEDIKRWKLKNARDYFYFIFELGVWATLFYRFSRMLFLIKIPIIKIFTKLIAFFLMKLTELFFGVALSAGNDIGPGFYIGHTGSVRIHPEVKIGKAFSLGPGVLIGTRGGGKEGVATIGDNVYVGVGAKILGKVSIGDNVRIGANAVVLKNIPANATAVGIPAKIIANA